MNEIPSSRNLAVCYGVAAVLMIGFHGCVVTFNSDGARSHAEVVRAFAVVLLGPVPLVVVAALLACRRRSARLLAVLLPLWSAMFVWLSGKMSAPWYSPSAAQQVVRGIVQVQAQYLPTTVLLAIVVAVVTRGHLWSTQ